MSIGHRKKSLNFRIVVNICFFVLIFLYFQLFYVFVCVYVSFCIIIKLSHCELCKCKSFFNKLKNNDFVFCVSWMKWVKLRIKEKFVNEKRQWDSNVEFGYWSMVGVEKTKKGKREREIKCVFFFFFSPFSICFSDGDSSMWVGVRKRA